MAKVTYSALARRASFSRAMAVAERPEIWGFCSSDFVAE